MQKIIFFLCLSLIVVTECSAQKPSILFDLGYGYNSIISAGKARSLSYHAVAGVQVKSYWGKYYFSSFGLQCLYHEQSVFNTTLYDFGLNAVYTLETSFQQYELGMPLLAGIQIKRCSLYIGCIFKYLLTSNLNQYQVSTNAISTVNTKSKYRTINNSETAMFNLFNYAPAIRLEVPVSRKLNLSYQFSYDLEVSAVNYYFASYNTWYHTIFISYILK